jgi:methylated-DNA-[protein]-cysteine S-methyltransferase
MTTRHTRISTTLGELTLVAGTRHPAAVDDALTGVYFPHHWTRPALSCFGRYVDVASDPLLACAQDQLGDYLTGGRTTYDLPVRATGEEFQLRVWGLLEQIPYGTTTTYGSLAEELGDVSLAREVGHAVGRNPLSIVVPCHRVVGKGGRLTGYAGGLQRKRLLLQLEEPAAVRLGRLF